MFLGAIINNTLPEEKQRSDPDGHGEPFCCSGLFPHILSYRLALDQNDTMTILRGSEQYDQLIMQFRIKRHINRSKKTVDSLLQNITFLYGIQIDGCQPTSSATTVIRPCFNTRVSQIVVYTDNIFTQNEQRALAMIPTTHRLLSISNASLASKLPAHKPRQQVSPRANGDFRF